MNNILSLYLYILLCIFIMFIEGHCIQQLQNHNTKREIRAVILTAPAQKSFIKSVDTYNSYEKTNVKRNQGKPFSKDCNDQNAPFNDPNNESHYKIMMEKREDKGTKKEKKGPKVWDHWGKWSSCSSTCGIGKMTRWRHCVSGGCARGEKEAQIRTCTSPAC